MEYIIIGCVVLLFIYIGMKSKNSSNPALDIYNNMDYQTMQNLTQGISFEKIVNDYGAALAKGTDGVVRPMSLLKNTKWQISKAIQNYIRLELSNGTLTKPMYDSLVNSFLSIEKFVEDDEANIINTAYNNLKVDKSKAKEFFEKYGSIINPSTELPVGFPEYYTKN